MRSPEPKLPLTLLASLSAWIAIAGCADLPRIEENTCGNRVVEEDAGEDCDGEESCGPQGSEHACRFLCGQDVSCPVGFGCGADGVCRRAKGAFEPLLTKSVATTLDLLVGEANGDRCSEVVVTTSLGVVVGSVGRRQPGLCEQGTQLFPLRPGKPDQEPYPSPFLTDLDGDTRPELIVPGDGLLSAGLRVYSSGASASLAPQLYTTEDLGERGVRPLRVRVRGRDKLFLFLGDPSTPAGSEVPDGGAPSDECGAATQPDGGTPLPDGGPPPPDGGPPPPDGGPPPPDGGPPPPDGGPLLPPDGGPPPPDGGPPPPEPRPRGASTIRVAGVDAPGDRTRTLRDALEGGGLGAIAALQAGDIDPDANGDGVPDPEPCDEIALAYAGGDRIHLYGACDAKGALAFSELPGDAATVTLDSGAIRTRNAAIALVDIDGDGLADILTNASDCSLHVAYGNGVGGFNSTPVPRGAPCDQKTSPLTIPDPNIASMAVQPDSIFVVGKFDPNHEGVQIAATHCPGSVPFSSDLCEPIAGDCETVVADIDGDGLDDLVSTLGQELGLVVGRAYAQGNGFHNSFLVTECPPHHLATGDFDDDGVNDVAFVDEGGVEGGAVHRVLKIAYGNAFGAPSEPRLGGILEGATALVGGRFMSTSPDQQASQSQLYAARGFGDGGSGISLLAGDSSREVTAPLYVPDLVTEGDVTRLADLEILAATSGTFTADGAGLAVVARSDGHAPTPWLLRQDAKAGRMIALPATSTLTCTSCPLAAVGGEDALDELLVFDDQDLVVFAVGADGRFAERSRQPLLHDVRSVQDGSNPRRYVPRPLVVKLDEDAHADVVLRAVDGSLVAFWGKGDGKFEERVLFPAMTCEGSDRPCAGQAAALVGVDATGRKKLVRVGPQGIHFYELDGREAKPILTTLKLPVEPPIDTDFVAVGAADLDGDGVDDLVIMPNGSSIHVLRGIPVRE